ncbi:MAG: N-acetylmuramoyl-L-alanine amidase [Bacteroidales bacterium]|jgi:N-acetylmuramoyl-L-alanine amidase|nr:N-acetylmuramoyl-L-alanine amidase [Bacteroidales bacterium]
MQVKSKSYFGAAIAALLISAVTYFVVPEQKTFTHVDYKQRSAAHFVIVSGHGSMLKGKYQTSGKQSPTWPDSLKIYEGYSTKLLAYDLASKLTIAGLDCTIINNYNTDMSLLERVQKVNDLFKIDNRLVLISLHHDAQDARKGDYTDFEGLKGFTSTSTGGATGLTVFTSPGQTESDNFADNYLLPAIKGFLPKLTFRNNGKSKEANFYVLSKSSCPAVLIEFYFMTTWSDCKVIADPTIRNNYTSAISSACINYNNYLVSR